MCKFFGGTYMYPTPADGAVRVGVCQGLGDIWIVGYQVPGKTSTRRIKTPLLPPMTDPARLQGMFDAWASRRRLREVA